MSIEEPRKGRSYCSVVWSNDCLAPAGFRSGGGYAGTPGVHRQDLLTCYSCGEPVCLRCSTKQGERVLCRSHLPDLPEGEEAEVMESCSACGSHVEHHVAYVKRHGLCVA